MRFQDYFRKELQSVGCQVSDRRVFERLTDLALKGFNVNFLIDLVSKEYKNSGQEEIELDSIYSIYLVVLR